MRLRRWVVLAAAGVLLVAAAVVYVVQVRESSAGGPPGPGAAAQPQVQGNRLVDARTGEDWVPRGVNWSSFEYACAQGWAFSNLDTLVARDPVSYEAASLASWGMNTVRLPLNQDCWLGTRGAPVSDQYVTRTAAGYRDSVARFVAALNAAGLVVVLDLHSRKRIASQEFGNLAMPDPESLTFWRSVGERFAANPSVMFDAFNEPYSRYHDGKERWLFQLSWPCWRDGGCRAPLADDQTPTSGEPTYDVQGMQAVVDTIRDTGATQPILLGGLDYANDLREWLSHRPDDDQLVAAFHSYDFKRCADPECWDEELAAVARSVPLLAAELGATDPLDGYVEEFLRWADEHRVGALFWVWAAYAADPMSLLRDQGGAPSEYGRLARSWLQHRS